MKEASFDKAYDPKAWEGKILERWNEADLGNPDTCVKIGVTKPDAKPFALVLPPPNVTGTLHIGHAAMLAIEDAVVRFKRMSGYRTLWLPGTDHAAIATESKVEKLLREQEGKSRHDIGREAFLRHVEAFARESHDTIVNQVKRMGSSVDWSREAYTLDDKRSLAVRTAFQKMFEDGIIYRGNRSVNWDPVGQTTISDDELVYKEEKAKLYYLKYGPFEIATARPETKFGDKYVVMHPDDERYKEYKHGDTLTVEWINGPIEATILKDEIIDREFGTGVMTITPWHSRVDFELAERLTLDMEPIIGLDGKLLPIAGEFAGLPIAEAKDKIVFKLAEKGLVTKIDEDYVHQVATAERTGALIEPQVMRQWFIAVNKEFERDGKTTTLKRLMQDAVRAEDGIEILPERFEKIYFHWIDNLRDWCISRQIWFGHRIPVWYCLRCEKPHVNLDVTARWFIIRHGETESNAKGELQGQSDSPLTEKGREQVMRSAEQLKEENIGLIISSDLGRCRETAEIIAQATGAEIVYDPAFRERSLGEGEGLHRERIRELFGNIRIFRDKPIAGMESYEDVEERVTKAFRSHHKKHSGKNVVIVSHGGAIRMLSKAIKNLTPDEAMSQRSVRNASVLSLDFSETECDCGGNMYEQDPDTLDTWFSSGLWTFSTLGWPDEKEWEKHRAYHPTSLLETGYDILFFWVARMILMSEYLIGEKPFSTVYLHGLVRDEKGRKMSKSLGNTIDPLAIAEEYGADALRLALVMGATPGNDVKVGPEKIKAMRNFVNKLWNMGRYIESTVPREVLRWDWRTLYPQHHSLTVADKWIMGRLSGVKKRVTDNIQSFNLSLASETLRDFTWNEVADWYIEIHKIEKNDAILVTIYNELLKLWHPFMPFVTESIHSTLYPNEKMPLMAKNWWESDKGPIPELQGDQNFIHIIELIKKIRNIRALYRIDPKTPLSLTLIGKEAALKDFTPIIERLARVSEIILTEAEAKPEASASIVSGTLRGFVHLGDTIDVAAETARLTKEKEALERYISGLKKRLADKHFTEKAPADIIENQKTSLAEAEAKLVLLSQSLQELAA